MEPLLRTVSSTSALPLPLWPERVAGCNGLGEVGAGRCGPDGLLSLRCLTLTIAYQTTLVQKRRESNSGFFLMDLVSSAAVHLNSIQVMLLSEAATAEQDGEQPAASERQVRQRSSP